MAHLVILADLVAKLMPRANCSASSFARSVRSRFVATQMDWVDDLAEKAIRSRATDEDTRFLLQALLLRDMARQNDCEHALDLADVFQDVICSDRGSCSTSSTGNVYFIRPKAHPGRLKIGYSVSPPSRLQQLQTGTPDKLTLVGSFKGSQADEREIHKLFAQKRIIGEWFFLSDESALHICSAVKSGKSLNEAVGAAV